MKVKPNAPMQGHTVLVTGASGFMGSWLTGELLKRGAKVVALLANWEPNSQFVRSGLIHQVTNIVGTVENADFLTQLISHHQVDSVFHLAAISVEGLAHANPHQALEINVRGTYNVLEACRQNSSRVRRIVVASSDKAYGDSQVLPYTEDLPLCGKNPYDVSKSCADLISQAYHNSYGLPVAIGRFGNIYGGGDTNFSRLIPGTISRLLNSKPPVIRQHANGEFRRDFLYVKDCVNAYLSLWQGLEKKELHGNAFNFAMGGTWAISEIVDKIRILMGREDIHSQIIQADHKEIASQHVSSAKARKLLGWAPKYNLDAGLAETVHWYVRFLTQSHHSLSPHLGTIAA